MSKERKLLSLAAKACGMPPPYDEHGVFSAWVGSPENGHWWDPINDDGDALRLAISLDMHIAAYGEFAGLTVWTFREGACECFDEPYGVDRMAATRMAIVRAAADMGEAMK